MTVLKRDTQHHTYADYLEWSRSYGDELIDGTAYVREPSPTQFHQEIVGELHRQGCYGRATVLELKGKTQLAAVPDVNIDWERVVARLS